MQADGIGGNPRVALLEEGPTRTCHWTLGLEKALVLLWLLMARRACSARLTTIQSLLVLPTSDRIGRPQAGAPLLELGSVTQESIALSLGSPLPFAITL